MEKLKETEYHGTCPKCGSPHTITSGRKEKEEYKADYKPQCRTCKVDLVMDRAEQKSYSDKGKLIEKDTKIIDMKKVEETVGTL